MDKESSAAPDTGSVPETEKETRAPLLGQGDGGAVEEGAHGAGTHKVPILIQSLAEHRMLPFLHLLLIRILVILGFASAVMGILAQIFTIAESINCHDRELIIFIFAILGSAFVVAALVLATVAGYFVSSFADYIAFGAQTFSVEINGCKSYKQPKALLLLLRSRINGGINMILRGINMILRDCSGSMIFGLIAVYIFLSEGQARRCYESSFEILRPVVFLGAAICALISVSCSLAFYLQMCDNAKAVAKEAIANGAVAKGAVAKGAVAKKALTFADMI